MPKLAAEAEETASSANVDDPASKPNVGAYIHNVLYFPLCALSILGFMVISMQETKQVTDEAFAAPVDDPKNVVSDQVKPKRYTLIACAITQFLIKRMTAAPLGVGSVLVRLACMFYTPGHDLFLSRQYMLFG